MTSEGPDTRPALRVCVSAPVASFRDPLYSGVQVGLPCPPPATVAGMLAAAAGGWTAVEVDTRFAMAFEATGYGIDVETFHPLDGSGKKADPTPKDRHFLCGVSLTVWLLDDIDLWQRRFRRPVWPLRLGRSQDLVGVRTFRVTVSRGRGYQRRALVPDSESPAGLLLRLPTAVSIARDRTRWDGYRYRVGRAPGADHLLDDVWVDPTGQAIVPLPPSHPVHAGSQDAMPRSAPR